MTGTDGIIKRIRDRVGTVNPVYLSIDIDTLDPACKRLCYLYSTTVSKLTENESKLPPLPAPPKQVVGQPVNSARSSAVLMDLTLSVLISLRLLQRMILMPS